MTFNLMKNEATFALILDNKKIEFGFTLLVRVLSRKISKGENLFSDNRFLNLISPLKGLPGGEVPRTLSTVRSKENRNITRYSRIPSGM